MATPEQELADEQLDAFLHEIGILSTYTESGEKEPALDHLFDEIFELADPPSLSPATPSLPTLPLEAEKKRRSFSIIWISVTLLFALLMGTSFGFFWGKKQGLTRISHQISGEKCGLIDTPIIEPQQEIATQISSWIKELTRLYETLEPSPPAEEIIEPIEPLTEMEKLAPNEIT